ncbi:acylphosphatase [Corynebacterium choanae]|uniref:acylphosphatase n=1 Tax=Corynebacterium choanae TaxID=1862358 RepID=A0A3G6J746_9CORY|nr:acylphosphatase [Corynebacterium choanae]AZA13897.1 Acylphosphatase [Corynebacterium choanae]
MNDRSTTTPAADARGTFWVHGRVQGVGFRWWTRGQALELQLSGSATNYPDGRVLVVAEGARAQVETLLERLQETPSNHGRPGRVDTVVGNVGTPRGVEGFSCR